MRAPYQVLIFLYTFSEKNEIKYCILKRKDLKVWQGIAGGGEDKELPLQTAKRETFEEAGIEISEDSFIKLNSIANISVEAIGGPIWGKDILEVPEYAFGLEVKSQEIKINNEHTEYKWLSYSQALSKLEWESNKNALLELNNQILNSF